MKTKMLSKLARKELVIAIRARYDRASKGEKIIILNEFAQVSGYHRKHAIRLLGNLMSNKSRPLVANSNKIYDAAVKDVLIILWETADRICGKRLKAVIPNLIESMDS